MHPAPKSKFISKEFSAHKSKSHFCKSDQKQNLQIKKQSQEIFLENESERLQYQSQHVQNQMKQNQFLQNQHSQYKIESEYECESFTYQGYQNYSQIQNSNQGQDYTYNVPKLIKKQTQLFQNIIRLDYLACQQLLYDQDWNVYKTHQFIVSPQYQHFRTVSLQYSIQNHYLEDLCAICQVRSKLIPNKCKHSYCAQCWFSYLRSQINLKSNLTPKCVDLQCQSKMSMKLIHFLAQSEQSRDTLTKFNNLLQISFVKKRNIKLNSEDGLYFIQKPKVDKKWNDKYIQVKDNLQIKQIQVDNQFGALILLKKVKQCPECGSYIEKNKGCQHMSCQCTYEFCWECLQHWEGGHICNVKRQNINKPNIYKLKVDQIQQKQNQLFYKHYKQYKTYQNIILNLPKEQKQYLKSFQASIIPENSNSGEICNKFIKSIKMLKIILTFLKQTQKIKYFNRKIEKYYFIDEKSTYYSDNLEKLIKNGQIFEYFIDKEIQQILRVYKKFFYTRYLSIFITDSAIEKKIDIISLDWQNSGMLIINSYSIMKYLKTNMKSTKLMSQVVVQVLCQNNRSRLFRSLKNMFDDQIKIELFYSYLQIYKIIHFSYH